MSRILLIIGDCLTIYLYGFMHRTFYSKRQWAEDKPVLYTIVYLADLVLIIGVNLMEIPLLNLFGLFAGFLIPLLVCYKINGPKGIYYFFLYVCGTLVMEMILGFSTGMLQNGMGNKTQYEAITPQVSVLMNLGELILVLFICRLGKKGKNYQMDKLTRTFMVIPLISVIFIAIDMMVLMCGQVKDFNPGQFVRTAVMMLAMNLAIFVVLERYTALMKRDMDLQKEKMTMQADNELIEVAAKSMKDRLIITEKLLQKDRVMRHDRRHVEALLLNLLTDGKYEEAQKCLEERLAIEPKSSVRYCENTAVNAAIGHYVSWAEREEIRMDVLTSIPAGMKIDELELAITISNLLENAIHACQNLPNDQRYIRFRAQSKNQLLLELENPFAGEIFLDENGYPFTNDKDHGIGTRSVLAFVNRTGSEIFYKTEDHVFRVRMIIDLY